MFCKCANQRTKIDYKLETDIEIEAVSYLIVQNGCKESGFREDSQFISIFQISLKSSNSIWNLYNFVLAILVFLFPFEFHQ